THELVQPTMDAYWKLATSPGKPPPLRQPQAPYNSGEPAGISNLAYIKLVPLTAAEAADFNARRADSSRRRGALIFCTGQLTGHTSGTPTFHPTKPEWFDDEITPYADSDIGIVVFEAMRG